MRLVLWLSTPETPRWQCSDSTCHICLGRLLLAGVPRPFYPVNFESRRCPPHISTFSTQARMFTVVYICWLPWWLIISSFALHKTTAACSSPAGLSWLTRKAYMSIGTRMASRNVMIIKSACKMEQSVSHHWTCGHGMPG